MSGALIYHKTVKIKANLTKVWDALINPEFTQQFMFGCIPITDWKIGSSLIWRGAVDHVDYVIGSVQAFEENQKLAFTTFDPNGEFKDIPENYLLGIYELTFADGITTIQISQGDFAKVEGGQKRFNEAGGGWDMSMDLLKKILEQ